MGQLVGLTVLAACVKGQGEEAGVTSRFYGYEREGPVALDSCDAAVQHTLHGVAVRDGRGMEGGDKVQLQCVAAHACTAPQRISTRASGCRLKLFLRWQAKKSRHSAHGPA